MAAIRTTTTANFISLLAGIPYTTRVSHARGLLAPLMRSMGHILFLLAIVAEEAGQPTATRHELMTATEKQNELNEAATHLDSTNLIVSMALSEVAKTRVNTYRTAVLAARDSFANWSTEDKTSNLRSLTNHAAGLAASLDRELAAIPAAQSDPGSSL